MICSHPWVSNNGLEYPCGKCLPCRINKKRIWYTRLVLEATLHSKSVFVTLTYRDENLPENGSVNASHVRAFIRALRFRFGGFRYFLVAEYGSSRYTERPHYHAVLYGLSPTCRELDDCWPHGFTDMSGVGLESMAYLADYTVTKLDKNYEGLGDRDPCFTRMSLRPGIGYGYVDVLAKHCYSEWGAKYIAANKDVWHHISIGGKMYPLGRYLVNKLRNRVGVPTNCPLRESMRLEEVKQISEDPKLLEFIESSRMAHAAIAERAKRRSREAQKI